MAFDASEKLDKCRACDSDKIIKYGKDKNGKHRYKCKNRGATFTETSYSVVSQTHYSLFVWEKYLELLLKGASLSQCAKECGISLFPYL